MMKKITPLLTLLLFSAFSFTVNAQYCGGSGTGVCTAPATLPAIGFYPPYDSLECAVIGTAYDETISFLAPTTVTQGGTTYNLNYIRVDTLGNLPCGLCWRMGNANNQISGGGTGCVRISGTTFDAPGQYKIRVIVTANVQVGPFPVNVANQNAESLGVKYWARVQSTNGSCPNVDTLAVGNTATIPGSIATPSISGASAICSGASTNLSVTGGTYYAYKWSTGASTSTISVNTGGTYTVTVYGNCASATATKTITASSPTPSITHNGPTTFCQGGSVTLDAGAGYSAYNWNNGSTSQTITVSTGGNYSVTVTQNSCTASDVETVTVNNAAASITPSGTVTICSGSSVTLDAGVPGAAYVWSNSATTQTTSVNSAGTYSVTVTQNGCTATDNVTVTVSANLAPNITPAGPINICPGGTETLDAGAGYDTYLWSLGDNTQTLQVSSAGTYSVTVTQGSCSGSGSITVTDNSIPLSIAISPSGPVALCAGDAVTLDAGAGYTSYNWSNTDQSQTITVTANGTYKVTAVDNGCFGVDSVLVTVTPIPSPAISPSGTQSICAGETITLDAGGGYDSYAWSNGATTQTVSVTANNTLDVTVTDNGCTGASSNSTIVTVNPVPTATINSFTDINSNYVFVANQDTAYTYDWFYGSSDSTTSVTSLGVNNDTLLGSCFQGGFYAVEITNQYNCSMVSGYIFEPICEGVGDLLNVLNVSIQPNPAKEQLQLSYELNANSSVQIFVSDISGKRVAATSIAAKLKGTNIELIDVSGLAQGIYTLSILSNNGNYHAKFIKE